MKASASRGLQPRTPGCSLNRSKRGAWEAAQHRDVVPFPSPGRLPRRLAFEKTAKQQLNVTKSHRRGKARERAWRAGRKYNIWRLPAAAQWSGIKKTRYLNSEQFLFFPPLPPLRWAVRKSAAGSQSFECFIKKQSCPLSFLSRPPPFSFPISRGHTEEHKKTPLIAPSIHAFLWSSPLVFSLLPFWLVQIWNELLIADGHGGMLWHLAGVDVRCRLIRLQFERRAWQICVAARNNFRFFTLCCRRFVHNQVTRKNQNQWATIAAFPEN